MYFAHAVTDIVIATSAVPTHRDVNLLLVIPANPRIQPFFVIHRPTKNLLFTLPSQLLN